MLLYDSLSRRKVELPAPPGPIRMYVCGPTVYQRIHIGNARPFVVSMWMRRWFLERGYDVKLVENITDINDKIYEAAARQQLGSAELAEQAARWYIEDTEDLGLGRPDVEPRATEVIPEIVALIGDLIDRGLAYESGGDVYFRVSSYPAYGELSGAQPDDMIAQEPSDLKEDPRDFALWKTTKAHEDTQWDPRWGPGRPGWHIECSAMAEKHLGPEFEIHGGGLDLVFPHHENEIAQSRALDHPFAQLWMHNGMLTFAGEEMHKSVGNDVTLKGALDRWGSETLLTFFLTGHWRKPLEYSDATLDSAAARAEGFREVFRNASEHAQEGAWERFAGALDDDFNTAAALAVMHEWRDHDRLRRALGVFGLDSLADADSAPAEIVELAERRVSARSEKDFAEADRLRAEIEEAGWDVRDEADGFRLVRRR